MNDRYLLYRQRVEAFAGINRARVQVTAGTVDDDTFELIPGESVGDRYYRALKHNVDYTPTDIPRPEPAE